MNHDRDCETCGETICPHGVCECLEEPCRYCRQHQELERQAEVEARWQRDVIGPLLGFDQEDQEDREVK